MKVAFIPPFSLLETTRRTDYQLMLPHLIGNVDYASMYREHGDRDHQFVILDNGEAEGEQMEWEALQEIARVFNVDEMVLPDVMGDATETRQRVAETILNQRRLKRVGLMMVLQGQTMSEVLECAEDAIGYNCVTTIGIPRHLPTTLGDPQARWTVVDALLARYPHAMMEKQIHLLGMNPGVPREMEFGLFTKQAVRGFDTSAPFNFAYHGHEMDLKGEFANGFSRPKNYFERSVESFSPLILEHNLHYLERFTK